MDWFSGGRSGIGRYETATGNWTFFYYPLDRPASPNGGWVSLSDLEVLDDTTFAVLERDNQAGDDARVKRLYRFSIAGLAPQPQGGVFPLVRKSLVRNLMLDLVGGGGPIPAKVEGLAVTIDGEVLIVNDNGAVAGATGETRLLRLGPIFAPLESGSDF